MVMCSIQGCKNKSSKEADLSFFTFPRDENLAKEWLKLCRPNTTVRTGRVCSVHFLSTDYYKSLQQILLNYYPKRCRRLQKDAIPSLHLNETPVETVSNVQESLDAIIKITVEPDFPTTDSNDGASKTEFIDVGNMPPTPAPAAADQDNHDQSSNIPMKKRKCIPGKQLVSITQQEYKQLLKLKEDYEGLMRNLRKIFTPGQIRCLHDEDHHRIKWGDEDVASAIALRNITPKGYRHLKYVIGIPLPGLSTLKRWGGRFEIGEGVLDNVITLMKVNAKTYNDAQKMVALSFDEMKVEIQKGKLQILQCVMARGLLEDWKQPIYYKFGQKMTIEILMELITKLYEAGLKVVTITCDMSPHNEVLLKELNIGIEDFQQTWFKHPVDENLRVHVFIDAPQLLKLARNNFIDYGFLYVNVLLTKDTIEKVYALKKFDSELASKISLASKHLNLDDAEREKVLPAMLLFSNTTASAIETCGLKGYLSEEDNWVQLKHVFKTFHDWFDVFNSKLKDLHRRPYGSNIPLQNEILEHMNILIQNVRTSAEMSNDLPFQRGILISNKSLPNLYMDLRDILGTENKLITSRLNLETVENFASFISGKDAESNDTVALSFKQRIKRYVLGKYTVDVGKPKKAGDDKETSKNGPGSRVSRPKLIWDHDYLITKAGRLKILKKNQR